MQSRNITTTDNLKGKAEFVECEVCRKKVKLLFTGMRNRKTCSDCTPKDDQFMEVIE